MKICLLTTSFPRDVNDDAGIFIARLVAALSQQGIKGIIVRPADSNYQNVYNFRDWEVYAFRYGLFKKSSLAYGSGILPNIKANPLLILQVPLLLLGFFVESIKKGKNSDLLHANWIATAIPGILAAKIINRPIIVTVRGEDLKLLEIPLVGEILKSILNYSDAITSISEPFVRKLEIIFPGKKIFFSPNGVDAIESNFEKLQEVKKELDLELSDYVIFAGRLIALKRIEILIRLLASLEDKKLKLVLCGALNDNVYVENLKNLANSLGVLARVVFAGQISPQKYLYLLSGARQYWSASEYEGRPNGVLEAFAQGIPCILSKIEAHQSLVSDGENGFLFEENTLGEISKQLDTLLKNKEISEKLSVNAKKSVAELSWQKSAKIYTVIYNLFKNHK